MKKFPLDVPVAERGHEDGMEGLLSPSVPEFGRLEAAMSELGDSMQLFQLSQ